MGVYTRFKQRGAEGFRALVQLMETTPASRRQKMIDVGMEEDALYTSEAMRYMISFKDILGMDDMELAELLSDAPATVIAPAIFGQEEATVRRFLTCCPPPVRSDVKLYLEGEFRVGQVGGAQLKMVEYARRMEQRGLYPKKTPPLRFDGKF